jgi:hypothetical protein
VDAETDAARERSTSKAFGSLCTLEITQNRKARTEKIAPTGAKRIFIL